MEKNLDLRNSSVFICRDHSQMQPVSENALASYKGQKYEKAVVTKIIKDNLAEDGSRYGTQKVLVK